MFLTLILLITTPLSEALGFLCVFAFSSSYLVLLTRSHSGNGVVWVDITPQHVR